MSHLPGVLLGHKLADIRAERDRLRLFIRERCRSGQPAHKILFAWDRGCWRAWCEHCTVVRWFRARPQSHRHRDPEWRYMCHECQRIELIGQLLPEDRQ